MKKLIYFILLILLSFILIGCNNKSDRDFTDGKVRFVTVQKVPVVKGKLNGKDAYYIIDSGASLSCLDDSQKDSYKFSSYDDAVNGSGFGYGGVATFKSVNSADATIGGVPVNVAFKAQDLSLLTGAFRANYGINIVGIVGCDWLKENHIIIDFYTYELRK